MGEDHTIILLSDNTMLVAGNNGHGQLALGHTEDQKTFQKIT